jgi:hypothetical protein
MPPIPNPLVKQGIAEIEVARSFMQLIEKKLIEKSRNGMPKPWVETTTTPADEIVEALAPNISQAASMIAQWLNQDCNGDMGLMQKILDRFWAKWAIEKFKSPDLSSLVMIAYEEALAEEGGKPIKGFESWPAVFVKPAVLLPLAEPIAVNMQTSQILIAQQKESMADGKNEKNAIKGVRLAAGEREEDEIEIRLVSTREILRQYFQQRPEEYAAALATILELGQKQIYSPLLLARLGAEKVRIGAVGICIKLWQVVRWNNRMPPRKIEDVVSWGAAPTKEPYRWKMAPRWLPLDFIHKLRLVLEWIEKSKEDRQE